MVFGPAIDPSLVTWPTSTTAIAFALGELHEPQRSTRGPGRRCRPRRPARRSSRSGSSRRRASPGRADRATSTIRPTSRSARTSMAEPGRCVEQAEPFGAEADLGGRLLAGGVEDRPTDAGGGLEQERGLADAGLAAEEDQRTRDDPAAEDPVELADRRREARDGGLTDVTQRDRIRAGETGADRRRDATLGSWHGRRSRRGCSTRRRRGIGPPSEGRLRRSSDRRTGSWPWPREGQCASTGVRDSAAWMSRPASGSLSTTIVVPGS